MSTTKIVIKIGTSSLTAEGGGLSEEKLRFHADAIAELKKAGHEVLVVSSGAVGSGFRLLGYTSKPKTIEGKQAAAAVGQGLLMHSYNQAFSKYGYPVGQVLLTRNDFAKRNRYNNAFNTLSVLLKQGAIPIINENDTVSIDELTFGDNDMLSVLVSGLIQADLLVIITDIGGLYDSDPRENKNAKRLSNIPDITPEVEAMAGVSKTSVGTGGMKSKLMAAKLALSLGIRVFIGSLKDVQSLVVAASGNGDGTYFGTQSEGINRKKQWIAFHSEVKGQIIIDAGAVSAIMSSGKSLLPAGVKNVVGYFNQGDVVEVLSLDGNVLGRGVINYSSKDLDLVKGETTQSIKEKLKTDRLEVIHRDDWFALV